MIRYIVKFFKPLLLYAISITILPGNAYATSEINDQEQIALIRAAKCGNVKTIKHLLDAGYDVNTTDHHGYNLLMQSITADTYDTAEASNYLVKRGADLAQQAYDGTSTLDLAVNFEKMSLSSSIFRGITTDQYFNLADYKPTISFFITDLKFDNKGNIKILEFGEGTRSYFKGHDQLYPKGLIWQRFWKYLGEKNLPVWHIGNLITAAKEADEISIATCKAYGGTLHTSLHILEKEPAFKRVIA
ncbi:ankyrin repeat domain-containing protein, partial [Candidatus Dependentiae bacterium]|nr:ankyrin repeat domain-containing protein [Candidatus Dependentiae bacterium]